MTGIDTQGRLAHAPSEFPAGAWRDIVRRVVYEFSDDRVPLVAAGAAFYVLLALVPALAALVALYGLLFDRSNVAEQMTSLAGVLPEEVRALIGEQLVRLTSEDTPALSVAFAATLALSLWSASSGTKAVIDGLNIVYDESEKRSFLRYNLTALGITTLGLATLVLALAVTVVVPAFLETYLAFAGKGVVQLASYAVLVVALWLAISALFRWGPSRENARWRWLAPGSLLAVLLLALFSLGFSWFARTFASYSSYGSIGAAIAFLTWCWISLMIVLGGAEINAEMEHQTARDSTTGPPLPMGARGAAMADTLGASYASARNGDGAAPWSGGHGATSRPAGMPLARNDALPMVIASFVIGAAAYAVALRYAPGLAGLATDDFTGDGDTEGDDPADLD
mgnify:CR=1 FL=1